ncbi:MAG: beta-ketoacyl-ACP synthase II [Candidatus Melainabacteria bacterium]|nr:beta-ketoacyl-ACP synthase II [Candidatus Melainabacteria bacterium]
MTTSYTKKRVVVTGMGGITPMGQTIEHLWQGLIQGQSGIGYITMIPEHEMTCRIGGECRDFKPEDYLDRKEARRMDRFTQFAIAASQQAMKDAGLNGHIDHNRMGVVIGSGAGGIGTIQGQLMHCLDKGFHKCSPFLVPMMISDMAAGQVSIHFKAKGPCLAVVSACATGADSIGDGMRLIQNDEADVVIAGGAESPIASISVAGFAAARALSMREDEPTRASRPFDKNRDGFVMSEGSGIVVLESYDHAIARGATIYAEIVGYGRSADANDIVSPSPDGDGASRAMLAALRDAGLQPEAIHYVNAHGTSTPAGDVAETVALKRVFGEHARNGLLVSSTKSMHGHMLGAAGAVEAIVCVNALIHGVVPPTINLDEPDAQCDLDYVAHTARPMPQMEYAMSNSFGFGGHNASLIFKKLPSAS